MSDIAQCAKCGYKIELHTDMLEMFYKSHDCEKTKLQEVIQRVRELHRVIEVGLPDGRFMGACSGCMEGVDYNNDYTFADYPCPTIKALDGEV